MTQAGKNDYQQLATVYLSSGTLDKIVLWIKYKYTKSELGWVSKTELCNFQTAFFVRAGKMGLVNCLFHFRQVCQNIGALFFSNLMLDVIKNCIRIHSACQRCSSEMVIDWATLAAMYRLCFSIF